MRRLAGIGATLALTASGMIALAPPASAGSNLAVTLTKTVFGTAPAGTVFTVHYNCGVGPVGNATFNASGGAIAGTTFTNPNAGAAGACIFTETGTGGADSVKYTCTPAGPCHAAPEETRPSTADLHR